MLPRTCSFQRERPLSLASLELLTFAARGSALRLLPSIHQHRQTHIQKSRLIPADGTLYALVIRGFTKSSKRNVRFSTDDQPILIPVLHSVLYLQQLELSKHITMNVTLAGRH